MNQESDHKKQFLPAFLTLLILTGILCTTIGIFVLNEDRSAGKANNNIHNFEKSHIEEESEKSTLYGGAYALTMQGETVERSTPAADKGVTVGEVMRWTGILAVLIAVSILVFIEFFYKHNIRQMNYRILLIISLFVLPVLVGLGATATVLETTKTVQSCSSCHVMDPFVNDLYDSESSTLASRHYKNKWISEYQCYTCHTTYGAHGTLAGKRDGFRHWLLFVTRTWDEPISYSGSYPNQNCINCHGGTQIFTEVQSHRALSGKLQTDEVSCTSCHGPAHPTPDERYDNGENNIHTQDNTGNEVNSAELAKLMELINE